ncbi:MAG TPA: serine hydrolase domain-containing protein [Steroidobacteraceae bacterium]|jgi:CubicO group peptidase (beta-lactamase class C family)
MNMIKRARAGLLLLAFLTSLAGAAPKESGDLMPQVDSAIRAEMLRQKVPGVALGIVEGGKVIASKGYGYANVELGVPVSAETIFQSGSVGKQFTSTALMLQVEEGKVGLDDSITKYFTDAPPSWRAITVRNLLTHTSGIPDYESQVTNAGDGVKVVDYRRDYTEEEMTKIAYSMPLRFAPGTRWSYSNTGYVLLGILVHKVSGRFYGDVLKDRIFKPLGMKTARVISEADIVPHRAAGYRLVNGELKNQEWVSPSMNSTADGSLYLSMLDFIAWDRGLRAHAILKPESWAQIYTPIKLKSGKPYPYGFGWDVDETKGAPWYHHGGSWQGFKTYISRYLADDLTIVVLTNLANADPDRFVDDVAQVLDPKLAQIEPSKPIPDSEPKIAARVRELLAAAGGGKLSAQDLSFAQGEAAEQAKEFNELLRPLGALKRLDLVDRRVLGDDRVSTYLAVYADRTLRVQMALAPDDHISDFNIESD